MKAKTKSSRYVFYGAMVVCALIEVAGCIRVASLFNFMANPDTGGFLPAHEDFTSARTHRLLWIAGMIVISFPLFWGLVIKAGMRNLFKNLLASVYVLFLILLITEGVFMYLPKSDSVGLRLSHDLWSRKYWHSYVPHFDSRNKPMQLRGQEDYAWKGNGKKKIFIVGDSFCAGDGIEENRMFSSLLASQLPAYTVINICERAADTRRENENLKTFLQGIDSGLPDVLIWQYYANDIENFARLNNMSPAYPSLTRFQKFASDYLQRKSYLADYVYWEIIYPDRGREYLLFLQQAYAHSKTIREHLEPVDDVVTFFAQKKIPVLVIIFPLLHDIPQSEKLYTHELTTYLQSKGVRVIDMSLYLEKIPVEERIVHRSNPHPSARAHSIAAEKLLEALRTFGYR